MKKRTNTKLTFNKNTISKLQEEAIRAGQNINPYTADTKCKASCKMRCQTSGLRCDCDE